MRSKALRAIGAKRFLHFFVKNKQYILGAKMVKK